MTDSKRCSKCGEVKDSTEFFLRDGGPQRRADCKACCRKRNDEWVMVHGRPNRKRNREQEAAYSAAYAKNHPERMRRRAQRVTAELRDAYVSRRLGIPVAEVPQDLMEMKREQLSLRRLMRELVQELEKQHGN